MSTNNKSVRVRYDYTVTRERHSKKGKILRQHSGGYISVNFGAKWENLAYAVERKCENWENLAAYCDHSLSIDECKIALVEVSSIVGAEVSDGMREAMAGAVARIECRRDNTEKREREIIAGGRSAFCRKGSAVYGNRWDKLSEKYAENENK